MTADTQHPQALIDAVRNALVSGSWPKDGEDDVLVGVLRDRGISAVIDAALAYDDAARRLHGEFARLNFPNEMERAA